MNARRFFAARGTSLMMALAALALLAAPAAWADPPIRAARLNYVTGPVSLAPAGLPDEWGEAVVNRPLTIGDRLWADRGARAELRLGSTALRIDGGTSLDILDIDDRMLQVALDQGRTQVRTRGGAHGNAEIDTPAAAVVVNGAADVRIDVDASNGRTFVAVRYGRANVYTQAGESFDLASGETTRIDADGRYYSIGRAGPRDAFDNFAYARDQRWREPRYVSVEMTGYEDLDNYGAWQPAGEYGTVWFPRQVAADWVPYRDGRWVWVEPWGWTWVDNAPWGFAPFHYGRWVQVNNRWGWWPGERVAQPVYAPALVAFFGGDDFGISVSVGSGPAVGWFPLGYRDPYIPWYTTSPTYRRSVNVAYVRDPVVLNQVVNVTNINVTNVTNIRYAYRDRGNVATVVPRQAFVSAQPVRQVAVAVPVQRIERAQVIAAAPAAPERESFLGKPGRGDRDRPSRADRVNRPVVAVNAPAAAPPRFEQRRQAAQQAQGKPFEVKPLRDDRREARREEPNRTAQGAQQPGAAPTASATPTERNVRVIKPAPTETRQARDRGARPENAAEGRPQAGQQREAQSGKDAERQAQPREAEQRQAQQREAQPGKDAGKDAERQAQQRDAERRQAQQRDAQAGKDAGKDAERQAQQRDAEQRQAQQRDAQQRQNEQRQAQQRDAEQRQAQQREAQAGKDAERQAQQREAEQRQAQQRDAQQRQNEQRQAQQREAEQRQTQQREAQQRQNEQRQAQQREAEQRQAQQREAQQRQNEQRQAQQREAEQRQAQQRQQAEAQQRQAQQREAQQRDAQQRQAEAQQRQARPQPAQQAQGQDRGRDDERGKDDRDEKDRGRPDRRG